MIYYLMSALVLKGYAVIAYVLGFIFTLGNAARVTRDPDVPKEVKSPLFTFWLLFELLVMYVYFNWLQSLT